MTELEEIAASVAKALGLETFGVLYGKKDGEFWVWLDKGGSNLFDVYWRCACLDWLAINGWDVCIASHGHHHIAHETLFGLWLTCPSAEFPARAIHAIMQRGAA